MPNKKILRKRIWWDNFTKKWSVFGGPSGSRETPPAYIQWTIKPQAGAYLFQAHLRGGGGEGGRNRDAGIILEGGLFNLEKTMVSVLHKAVDYKVEKLKNKKVRGHAAEIKSELPVGKSEPSRISPHAVLQSRLINTIYHLSVKNN